MDDLSDLNNLAAIVKKVSDSYWAERSAPVLLSALPSILESESPNYRTVLGRRTLKAFIEETAAAGGYRLIQHPVQRARVGVAPATASYEFPVESAESSKAIAAKSNKEVTLAFIQALATLPGSDLEKVVIPASVLVKLLK